MSEFTLNLNPTLDPHKCRNIPKSSSKLREIWRWMVFFGRFAENRVEQTLNKGNVYIVEAFRCIAV